MQRWNALGEVPADFGPAVVTIGNFDGVHRGHRAVLERVVALAHERGARAVAITFDPHPLAVLYPDRAPAELTGLAHRLDLLAATGLDAVLVLPFTREFATWTPERFVTEVLVEALDAVAVVVGRDTRFGHRNSGDVGTLTDLGDKLGFEVQLVEDLLEGSNGSVGVAGATATGDQSVAGERRHSSTWVRQLLADGDVTGAADVLGRHHQVTGTVVHGDHRGRELGFPTANLCQPADGLEGMVPADGVYAGWLVRSSRSPVERLPAAISVGTNPTFNGHERRVEAYVLDRTDLDLYGERVGVEFVARLRPTLRFADVAELISQMAADVTAARDQLAAVPDVAGGKGPAVTDSAARSPG